MREFFLRRLMLIEPWQALRETFPKRLFVPRWVIPLALLYVAVSPVIVWNGLLPIFRGPPAAIGSLYASVGFYVVGLSLLVFAILLYGPMTAYPYCLRLMGSAFLGAFALASLGGDWRQVDDVWLPSLAIVVASVGFLTIQARAHGGRASAAVLRGVLVAAVGWTHSVGVISLALALGFPGFFDASLRQISEPQLARIIILGASVALGMGVFLQVLWEKRPATYPLGGADWNYESI